MQTMACLSIVLGCGPVFAASTTIEDRSAGPPLEHIEAQQYAQQLSRIIEQVGEKYVRPVSRAELATAALKGLYEAARLPIPPALHAEVQAQYAAGRSTGFSPDEMRALLDRHREVLAS